MRPALWMAAALALGVAAADWLRPHPALALVLLLGVGVWAAVSSRWVVPLLLMVFCLGLLRYAYAQTVGRGSVAAWQGQKVTLVATVVGEPELRQPRRVSYVVAVEQVNGHPASGRLHVTQGDGAAPGFGERVRLEGRLERPRGPRTPGGFDWAAYLARQGVYLTTETQKAERLGPGSLSAVRRWAVSVRIRLEFVLKETLPPDDAALAAGLMFGTRSDLPEDVQEAFRASGVFHLLAVSGGNIAMIVLPLLAILRRIGIRRRWSAAAAIPVVVFFVFLTGASPSVLRAGVMAVLVLLGEAAQREKNGLNTLGAAALLLLLWQPGILFDLGFQLSLTATLGILLFAGPIQRWLVHRLSRWFKAKAGNWLAAGLSVTLAAQVMVEPLSLHSFGAFSTIAPVANLLVLVFLDPVVKIGSVAALLGLAFLPGAWLLNQVVRLGLWLLVLVVKGTAAIPGAYLEVGKLPVVGTLLWFGALGVAAAPAVRWQLAVWFRQVRRIWRGVDRAARGWALACAALLVATGFTWRLALASPHDLLTVAFLDVGQGDAAVIQAPGGYSMLIDAGVMAPADPGRGFAGFDMGETVVRPYLKSQGIRRLDYLVLTHPDIDHYGGGGAVLREVSVGTLLHSGGRDLGKTYMATLQLAAEKAIPIRRPVAGERILLGPEVVLEVLNPPAEPFVGTKSDDNSNCVAFRLEYRKVRMLFACDLEAVVEQDLVSRRVPLQAHVLKVSHHGSGGSSTEGFLQAVRPQWAVISAGSGNPYGHPHDGTLERLQAVGAQVVRTDRQGTLTFKTDGIRLHVSTARDDVQVEEGAAVGILGRRWLGAW